MSQVVALFRNYDRFTATFNTQKIDRIVERKCDRVFFALPLESST
ncbi:MAG: hypothetical protein U7123_13190 [Potamolinea sp.]